VRERSRGSTHIPYRQSKLTQLLKSAFGKSAFTVVIATCSPSSGDTEHTLGTIAAVSLMDGQAGGA
jgi:kinesin family protein 2/24